MANGWSEISIANELIKHKFKAAENIKNKMCSYELKGFTSLLFKAGKELWKNGNFKKHTYGNALYIDVHIKVLVLKFYRYIGRNDLTEYQFSALFQAITKFTYDHFYTSYVSKDGELLKKFIFFASQADYTEHFMQQLAYFNAMVSDFEDDNFLIPFVINKKYTEFDDREHYSPERKMCAILAEDLLLDYCYDNLTATFNAFSSEKIPNMTREFYRACEPFYRCIFSELIE